MGTINSWNNTINDSVSAITINSGTDSINVSSDATNTTVNVATGAGVKAATFGSTNTTSSTTVACGTGVCNLGASATDHTTNVGSTTGTSATTLKGGSGGIGLTGTVTSANSITITTGNLSIPNTVSGGTSGAINLGGVNFIQNYGTGDTFIGASCGNTTTTTAYSTCVGFQSGKALTSGVNNSLFGVNAGLSLGTGQNNFMGGFGAGEFCTSGSQNVFVGTQSAFNLTTGSYNIILGQDAALQYNGAESSNIIFNAGAINGESNVCRIGGSTGTGNQQLNKTFIHGIRGITTVNNDAVAVLIDSAGQLGTVSSSIRYKENIKDIGEASDNLMKLRPVAFNYKSDSGKRVSYGLIAEEVAELYPNLVVLDDTGLPETIQYHLLPALLLNEIQKLRKELDELKGKLNV